MAERPRVTSVLGAWATVPVGGPTTEDLTKAVRANATKCPMTDGSGWEDILVADRVGRRLDEYLHPASCNFEDILHSLETMYSYFVGWGASIVASYRPRPAAFFSPRDIWWLKENYLISARRDLIEAVVKKVSASRAKFKPQEAHKWFANFWQSEIGRAHV